MLKYLNFNLEMFVLGIVTLFFLLLGLLAWILMFKNIYLKITKRSLKMKPCEACGHSISSTAIICPHCGESYRSSAAYESITGCIIAGIMFSVIGLKFIELFIEEFLTK
ncbi:zinc ribbon domain-containing protein [Paenibacillus illinoisensis]|uniref:Uncharacterized protein n=2 Tax=Paenibacillus TaxID=44249 RepID=A0A2W0CC21_9BACL|nr:zinc ribbon domain-containing protein [Paenibacillus illinoisensis]PYY29717.1 Uncharacterized protein PIL02S_01917 [Paenibacillus illinoisensis]